MFVVSKKSELAEAISRFREEKMQYVGFVPTMGFLHKGHGSLIDQCKKENGLCVCDIFVNPLQFNENKDYVNYPTDIAKDREYLEKLGCQILYIPLKEDIYPSGHIPLKYDFGYLETVMEGKHRPGHFQGVAEVVRILFEIVKPDRAYFGEKDFQQLKIIENLVKQFDFQIEIVSCPIIREPDGLALSSRNVRLTEHERKIAPFIFQQLIWCKEHFIKFSPSDLKKHIQLQFSRHSEFSLEYIEFADRLDLKITKHWDDAKSVGAFIAVRLGNVRLIDNIILF